MTKQPAILIPSAIRDAIREHVATAAPGHEVVGRLVIDAELRALRYVPMRNGSNQPHKAIVASSWQRTPGCIDIVMHNHPDDDPRPSAGDLAWSADRTHRGREHRSVFGIWAQDMLHVYRLRDLETKSFVSIKVLVEIAG
jgi:hypothetical protein